MIPRNWQNPERQAAFARDGRIVGIEFHVARNKQIEKAIVVVVAPGRARRPAAQRDSSLFRDIGERAVMIVVVEAVLAEIGNVDVGPAIVVVIADHHAKAPALIGHSGFVGHVGERSIVIVVEQHGPRRRFLALQCGERRAIQQIDVEPAVVVVVEQRRRPIRASPESCSSRERRSCDETCRARRRCVMSAKMTGAPSTKPPAVIGRDKASLTGARAAPVLMPFC